MDWKAMVGQIDAATARAFVTATRNVIDAMMIEGQRIRQTAAPSTHDYASAELDRSAPGGGWLTDEELRAATQRMSEAIAAERWADGVLFAVAAILLLK